MAHKKNKNINTLTFVWRFLDQQLRIELALRMRMTFLAL